MSEDKTTGAGALGWPLAPSKYFPGEKTLSCPKCGSTNVTMTVMGSGIGTGPNGRWRLGDPYRDVNICEGCGYKEVGEVRRG